MIDKEGMERIQTEKERRRQEAEAAWRRAVADWGDETDPDHRDSDEWADEQGRPF
jgi:hypothetical protein